LTISKGIIEAHGGRIWAANRPDGGAVVSFALPYVLGEPGEIRERLDEPARTAPADR
jgi:two-component system sensor histidine kinase KdpD